MRVCHYSREQIRMVPVHLRNHPVVCVSITDTEKEDAELPEGLHDTIRLKFDDIEKFIPAFPQLKKANLEQLEDLGAFLKKHRGAEVVVHCEAGISRSSAVAVAVKMAFDEYTLVEKDRMPNEYVLGHLLRILRRGEKA